MKKLLSVLMVASMVSFVACKGGKKDDAAKNAADSIENARVQDSIKNAMAPAVVDTTAKVDSTAKPAEGEMKKDDKKGDMHKGADHK